MFSIKDIAVPPFEGLEREILLSMILQNKHHKYELSRILSHRAQEIAITETIKKYGIPVSPFE